MAEPTILGRWMSEHAETDQTLAPKVGVSRVHISRLRRNVLLPSRELALKLQEVTEIPAATFLFGEAA